MSGFRDDADACRFELEEEEGAVAFATYRREPGRLVIAHVEAPPALRGTGAAGRLMDALLAQARGEGLKVLPLCSYAAHHMRRGGYADLLA